MAVDVRAANAWAAPRPKASAKAARHRVAAEEESTQSSEQCSEGLRQWATADSSDDEEADVLPGLRAAAVARGYDLMRSWGGVISCQGAAGVAAGDAGS